MEILVITLFGVNLGMSILHAVNSEGNCRAGWVSSALGWACAILGYAAHYGWLEKIIQ